MTKCKGCRRYTHEAGGVCKRCVDEGRELKYQHQCSDCEYHGGAAGERCPKCDSSNYQKGGS